ncbi:MAG TPA: molybdopterin molybdotransferase MoeA, partial [Anaerolineae bacterium]|nr:molybdopterin molybdotransferase MoeA [Anaerolineae bacterium]
MPEFFNVLPPGEARQLLFEHTERIASSETVSSAEALDRVTAEAVRSPHALPAFRRSTMDGYAVRAADTYGASSTLPAFLNVAGQVRMGEAADVELAVAEAAIVHTGGMIPESADAVVQIEHTQIVAGQDGTTPPFEIEVLKAVAVGQNVLQVGEDVTLGSVVLEAGHKIRPQDIGGVLALGIVQLNVIRRPIVGIIATGNEIIAPDRDPAAGQIRDINSYTVATQAMRAGGIPRLLGIVPDDLQALMAAASRGLEACDMLVLSAGSSVSVHDMTVQVIDALGRPGVLLHGVATRPGKPTIVGAVGGKPILGLPGNPVSAMVQFSMFGTPVIDRLQGLQSRQRQGIVWARLDANVASESGREDYVPAKVVDGQDGLVAS